MNTNTDQLEQQKRIRDAVLSKYAGVKDICVLNAIKEWEKERFDPLETEPLGERTHTVAAPEMEAFAVAWHQADIEVNIAYAKAHLAKAKLDESKSRFVSALAEFEGLYANSEDLHVFVPRMEVWKTDTDQIKRTLPRKVVAFCLAVVSGELEPKNLRDGYFPATFKEVQLLQDFVNDLLDFVEESGEEAKARIKKVCEDLAAAKSTADDENSTKPIRFLATQVVSSLNAAASLRQRNAGIGFGAVQAGC